MFELSDYHLVARFQQQSSLLAEQTAFLEWHPHQQQRQQLSWRQASEQVRAIANALLARGVAVQENITICATNSMNWALVDLAILHLRAVSVPVYATNTAAQAAYIVRDAGARILFVGGQEQMNTALALLSDCPSLQLIVALEEDIDLRGCPFACTLATFIASATEDHSELLQQRIDARTLDDLFTLIYTSGTTGEPKGVMLTYRNLAAQLKVHDACLSVSQQDVSLSFLPLSHIFERAWSFYIMHCGASNVYLTDTGQIKEALQSVKPTVMCAVPRFYEKIFQSVQQHMTQAAWYRRTLFQLAVWCGRQRFQAEKVHVQPVRATLLAPLHAIADRLLLKKVRALLGGRIRLMPAAGATLDESIIQFFQAIGVNVKYGYGMTETCATVSCCQDQYIRLGSVGKPLPGVELRIGDNSEIQLRSDIVMQGYFNRPEATREAFTIDGWLKTGDMGYLDEQGNLFMTERLKDLMKTSCGKYIAPQQIEGTMMQDRFIDHIAVIADARKYVSALIVPCFEVLEEYARSLNIHYQNRLELLRHHTIVALFEERLQELQQGLARFEQIKKFTLLPQTFSMEKGELTPTLKLRRKVIYQHYQHEIDAMYSC